MSLLTSSLLDLSICDRQVLRSLTITVESSISSYCPTSFFLMRLDGLLLGV